MSGLPRISFVIPVRDDAERLQGCLASIGRARYPSECVELIVVDNGSTDESADVAARAGARVLTRPGLRVAQLRNEGALLATGAVLAFVDADHEIDDRWIAGAVETLSRPGVAAVGAPYEAPPDGTWVQRAYDRLRHRGVSVVPAEWLGSGNLAVWRHAFQACAGFDTSLHTCEDVDLCQRLRARGSIMSDYRMRSVHHGDPSTLAELFGGELWRGRDNLRVSLRSHSLRSLAGVGLTIAELVLLVGSAAVLFASPAAAATGLAGFLLLTAVRAIRMFRASPPLSFADGCGTFVVSGVYGIARALALVGHAPHALRRRRRG
jgi:GT2 family glycosyltransferase